MDNSQVLQELFDPKMLAVLKLFFRFPERQFYLQEIAKESDVSGATTFRIVGRLNQIGLVKQIKVTRFKLYQLSNNENVEFLQGFLREDVQVIKLFLSQVKDIKNIECIVQHGKETQSRVNLLIIGEDVDAANLKSIAAEIKERYDFTISYLTLANAQYEQMVTMGLYSGQKKVLFEKR